MFISVATESFIITYIKLLVRKTFINFSLWKQAYVNIKWAYCYILSIL